MYTYEGVTTGYRSLLLFWPKTQSETRMSIPTEDGSESGASTPDESKPTETFRQGQRDNKRCRLVALWPSLCKKSEPEELCLPGAGRRGAACSPLPGKKERADIGDAWCHASPVPGGKARWGLCAPPCLKESAPDEPRGVCCFSGLSRRPLAV